MYCRVHFQKSVSDPAKPQGGVFNVRQTFTLPDYQISLVEGLVRITHQQTTYAYPLHLVEHLEVSPPAVEVKNVKRK